MEIEHILEMQRKSYNDATQTLISTLNERIDSQFKLNYELKHSLEFSQAEVIELKNDLKEAKSHLKLIEEKTDNMENTIIKLQSKIDDQEDFSRRKNIRIDVLKETPGENKKKLQINVQKIIDEKLNLNDIKIVNIHRLPKLRPQQDSPRPIIARLQRDNDRGLMMKNTWKLKNSGIFINEDVCENTAKIRKEKLPELKAARSSGKIAYFSRNKLIVHERKRNHAKENENVDVGNTTPRRSVASLVTSFTPENTHNGDKNSLEVSAIIDQPKSVDDEKNGSKPLKKEATPPKSTRINK